MQVEKLLNHTKIEREAEMIYKYFFLRKPF